MKFQTYCYTALPILAAGTFLAHAQDQVEGLGSQERELLFQNPDEIFDIEAYVSNIKSAGVGKTSTCMDEFRQIRFFEYEHFLHDPLNLAVDSGVVFEYDEEADFSYPVTIGQRSANPVNEKWAEKQCKESGGDFKVINGEYYADGGNVVDLLLLGLQGIAVRPGLLGNYQAIIALAIGYTFLNECEHGNMMPLFLVNLFKEHLNTIVSDFGSDTTCRETFIYRNRYACVPKKDSCDDDEIMKMLLISDATYYIIHSLDTKITNLLSDTIMGAFGASDDMLGKMYIDGNVLKYFHGDGKFEIVKIHTKAKDKVLEDAKVVDKVLTKPLRKAIQSLHPRDTQMRMSQQLIRSRYNYQLVRALGPCDARAEIRKVRRNVTAKKGDFILQNGDLLVNVVGELDEEEDILGDCSANTNLSVDKDIQKTKEPKEPKEQKRIRKARGVRR
ncbi:predicted protein [Chaetoceros tenuissimus]|uniref:Uncharacterized protein n=1 Tax=Chaetoceros tenuissimus TaxID=426638 RepID=A0AAD3CKI6_9STRA|nr:predicted protein [Chaetoceros tenuissimus]